MVQAYKKYKLVRSRRVRVVSCISNDNLDNTSSTVKQRLHNSILFIKKQANRLNRKHENENWVYAYRILRDAQKSTC